MPNLSLSRRIIARDSPGRRSSLHAPGKWSSGKTFLWAVRYLDSTREGRPYLRDRRIAELVVRALLYAERELHFYDLHAYVLMANHVHLLVTPQVEP